MLLVACAPVVDGPVEKQLATDRSDGDRLAAQLSALPGVVRSEVMLRRPVRDPLGVEPAGAERGHGKRERDRASDEAHVEARRMDDHVEVLEEWVQPFAVGARA